MALGQVRGPKRGRRLALLAVAGVLWLWTATAAAATTVTFYTDLPAGPPLMGLGVQWDPYDSFQPTPADWELTFQRLDFMRPGFIRVVEPASDYFRGYDSAHQPTYRWNSTHIKQLRTILDYAKSRGITVVLGDWGNPMIGGDPRIAAGFLQQLHDTYGYTNISYYNLINEPNYASGCAFSCWAQQVRTLAAEFASLGMTRWLSLVGPDNANSWDDTPRALAIDRTAGLDGDNPIGGDSWVSYTLGSIPSLIGSYDSHRYTTVYGLQSAIYQGQMYARREQISNLDSPGKPYFEGEAGITAREVSPFRAGDAHAALDPRAAPLVDPSAQPAVASAPESTGPAARASLSPFVDSQPRIREFGYGVWMGDMAIQAFSAGLAGASAWDLDDAMHVGGQYGSQNLKRWGFWNSLGGQDGYPASDRNLRPWFYTWALLARSFPAGSVALVAPTTNVPGLRVAAAKVPVAGGFAISLAVVNDSPTRRSLTLRVPSVAGSLTMARYDYFPRDRPVDANGFPVRAAMLQDVRLSAGLPLRLAPHGVMVLSSVGYDAARLNDAPVSLVDNLDGWGEVASRSRRLKLDHTTPLSFNGDRSRAVSTARTAQSVVYRARSVTSFELKAYFHGGLGIRVMGSPDGRRWNAIAVQSTPPSPSLGGHGWSLAELLPAAPLDNGINQLKVELLNRGTELSQVTIHHG